MINIFRDIGKMKKALLLLTVFCTLACLATEPKVKPGIEVLRDNGFSQLRGKRVGLITNPSGVDNELRSTIDILHEAPEVELVALYAPEHGVRGDIYAGEKVTTYTDPATGIPVYSIYGNGHKPSPEMLKDVDVLVYDIQDNGCRSFTFISTMGKAMEAAAENDIPFVVLDRPNPLGGKKVEGNLVEDDCRSFVSLYPIPYLYGLTPGELALYLKNEGLLENHANPSLQVIPMKGWERDMTFAETGMPWVLPSPHVPTPESAIYYPASGIVGELNYLNIGVGYTEPFKLFTAPWIDAQKLSARMNALNLPGIKFRPIYIKPFYGFAKGENCQGVEIFVTDPDEARLALLNFYIMQELAEMYPDHKAFAEGGADPKRFNMFDKVVGSKQIRQRFAKNHKVADIEEYWNKDTDKFRDSSSRYYIYK